jgi:hypothetical protein
VFVRDARHVIREVLADALLLPASLMRWFRG